MEARLKRTIDAGASEQHPQGGRLPCHSGGLGAARRRYATFTSSAAAGSTDSSNGLGSLTRTMLRNPVAAHVAEAHGVLAEEAQGHDESKDAHRRDY